MRLAIRGGYSDWLSHRPDSALELEKTLLFCSKYSKGRARPLGVHICHHSAKEAWRAGLSWLGPAPFARSQPADSRDGIPQLVARDPDGRLARDPDRKVLALYLQEDVRNPGDLIERTGKRLTTIYITHAHADHYLGLGPLVERFPSSERCFPTTRAFEGQGAHGGAVGSCFTWLLTASKVPSR